MEHFYGYGIVDKDGEMLGSYPSKERAEENCKYITEQEFRGAPFRVVSLYYKDEQS